MNKFKEFLSEARNASVHLEHLEDELFNRGVEGARDAVYFLRSLRDMLSGHNGTPIQVFSRWDTSFSFVAGTNPENGRFFVGTKSVLAGNTRHVYSESDIDKNYPDSVLAKKLKLIFRYLKPLNIPTILEGEWMFQQSDLKKAMIDGATYLTFEPNTTVYAIPLDSELANIILGSQIGVIFTTQWDGDSFSSLTPRLDPNLHQLVPSKDVWFRDSRFVDASGTASFTDVETAQMNAILRDCETYYGKIDQRVLNYIAQNETIKGQIKAYNSAELAGGIISDARTYVLGLVQSVTIKLNNTILAAKKSDTFRKREFGKNEILKFYRNNFDTLMNIFNLTSKITEAKMFVVAKLQSIKSIGMFKKTDDGFKVTAPGGFVAIDHQGKAIKLVDRLQFKQDNFTATKDWS